MRLLLKDLALDTDYELQARIKSNGTPSEWSPKFKFTTVTDQVAPKTPTGVTFIIDDDSWLAEWDTVTQNVDGSSAAILNYHLQLFDGTLYKNFIVAPSDETVQEYGWTFEKIKQLFGKNTTSLQLRIKVNNVARVGSDWSGWNSANIGAPVSPANAQVEETTDGLSISWTAPADTNNLAGYRVYVSTDPNFVPGPENMVYEGNSTTFTYLTSTYAMHYIVIRSFSKYGQESGDLTVSGTPKSPFVVDSIAPDVPVLSGSLNRSGGVATANLSWTFDENASGNDDIQAFAIKWYQSGDSSNYFIEFASKEARSLAITLPEPFSDYQFQIASVDFVANYSAYSAPITITGSIPGSPPQVTGLSVVPGLGDLQITWSASTADDVTYGGYYEVQIATDSGFTSPVIYKTGNTSLAVAGLELSTTYYVRVRAIDSGGSQGTYSTVWSGATSGINAPEPSDGVPPASSPGVTVTPGIGSLFVSWSPITNNDPVTYEVHVSVTSGFTPNSGTLAARTSGTVVTLRNTAGGTVLDYATTYYVKIVARDADGAAAAGTQGSGSPNKAGSSDIISIVADQIATSSLSASTLTLAAGGVIQSDNYSPEGSATPAGFKLSSSVVDIQSGTVNFGTLRTGTVTSSGLTIGAGGEIIIDSTGAIRSNNWASLSTGWKISSTGIELNDANSKIKASAIQGGTFTGGNFIVGSGGSITGTGFTISSSGINISNGNISASTITSGQLSSSQYVSYGGTSQPAWLINLDGAATFSDVSVRGRIIVGPAGSTDSSYIRSGNYSPGSAGWQIDATGSAEFYGAQVRGGLFSTIPDINNYGTRVEIGANGSEEVGSVRFYSGTVGENPAKIDTVNGFVLTSAYTSGTTTPSSITLYAGSGGGKITLLGNTISLAGAAEADSLTILTSSGIDMNSTPIYNIGGTGLTVASGGISVSGGIDIVSGNLDLSNNRIVNAIIGGGGTTNVTGTLVISLEAHANGLFSDDMAGGGSTGANVNNNGRIVRTGSSRRYKNTVTPLSLDIAKNALNLESVSFLWNEDLDMGVRRQPGFIAEQAEEVGMDLWVTYNKDGLVDGFRYAELTSAHNMLIKDLYSENESLKTRVSELEGQMQDVLSRLSAAGI